MTKLQKAAGDAAPKGCQPAATDTPPPHFMARCPKCNHELCGNCGHTTHYDENRERNVIDGDFCCQCDARFQVTGYRYA